MDKNIVWFPGHMAKARRKIAEDLKLVDIVIELLDARLPESSQNPDFARLFGSKPRLTLLTKSALADDTETARWIKTLAAGGRTVVAVDCKSKKNFARIKPAVNGLLAERLAAFERKGIKRPVRAMVAGITNVGKSTFINTFTGIKKAKAEDRPGVTRANQWIPSDKGIEFLDTPGVLWHKFEDRQVALKLACTGAIRDEILDTEELAVELLKIIVAEYPALLEARYKVELLPEENIYSLYTRIALKRGFLRAGGEPDSERCAAVLLDEFRAGQIGKITLDK